MNGLTFSVILGALIVGWFLPSVVDFLRHGDEPADDPWAEQFPEGRG